MMTILANGKYKSVMDLNSEDISLREIATRLGRICRFDGRIDRFYSVAEHVVNLSWYFKESPELSFEALHHDDHEAYIGDIITPIKRLMGQEFEVMDNHTSAVTREFFGLSPELDPRIKIADKSIATNEAQEMRPPFDWETAGWSKPLKNMKLRFTDGKPLLAARFYMLRHWHLINQMPELGAVA